MIDGCDDHDDDYCVFGNYVSFYYVHDYFNSNDNNDNNIEDYIYIDNDNDDETMTRMTARWRTITT